MKFAIARSFIIIFLFCKQVIAQDIVLDVDTQDLDTVDTELTQASGEHRPSSSTNEHIQAQDLNDVITKLTSPEDYLAGIDKDSLIIEIYAGDQKILGFQEVSDNQHLIKIMLSEDMDSVQIGGENITKKVAIPDKVYDYDSRFNQVQILLRSHQLKWLLGSGLVVLLALYILTIRRISSNKKGAGVNHDSHAMLIGIPTGHHFGNATHVGQVRKANEDYYGSLETESGNLFLVCDGMGGHFGGAKAAQLAVEAICNHFSQQSTGNPRQALSKSIIVANEAILSYARANPEFKGMGATCVALFVKGLNVYYAHVGDSRIYFLTKRVLHRITKDHSYVQSLVDAGTISETEAELHPRKNEITRALGVSNRVDPEVAEKPISVKKGDHFLLCSDGLTGVVDDKRIERVLKKDSTEQEKANTLIEMANRGGGPDNITVQVIAFN